MSTNKGFDDANWLKVSLTLLGVTIPSRIFFRNAKTRESATKWLQVTVETSFAKVRKIYEY